jgi:hypothetical protein
VVDPQGYLRFLVGLPNAFHVYQISTDEHRGRESRKKIPINVPLHGSVRRPKVIPGGCDFHVFHDLAPLVLAITRLTSSLLGLGGSTMRFEHTRTGVDLAAAIRSSILRSRADKWDSRHGVNNGVGSAATRVNLSRSKTTPSPGWVGIAR